MLSLKNIQYSHSKASVFATRNQLKLSDCSYYAIRLKHQNRKTSVTLHKAYPFDFNSPRNFKYISRNSCVLHPLFYISGILNTIRGIIIINHAPNISWSGYTHPLLFPCHSTISIYNLFPNYLTVSKKYIYVLLPLPLTLTPNLINLPQPSSSS